MPAMLYHGNKAERLDLAKKLHSKGGRGGHVTAARRRERVTLQNKQRAQCTRGRTSSCCLRPPSSGHAANKWSDLIL